jgi:hypothetical protein
MTRILILANGRQWKGHKHALAHFKDMLSRYAVGDVVSEPSDHRDLVALLNHYDGFLAPGQPTKVGVGIEHFSKETNGGPGWSTDGFHVHRKDGTSDDFSYIAAVTAK